MENLTLADWATQYDCSGKTSTKQTNEVDVNGLPMENFIYGNQNDDDLELNNITLITLKKDQSQNNK